MIFSDPFVFSLQIFIHFAKDKLPFNITEKNVQLADTFRDAIRKKSHKTADFFRISLSPPPPLIYGHLWGSFF